MPNEVWTPQQDGIIRGLRASLYQLRTVVTTPPPTPQSSEAIIGTSLYDGTLLFGLDGSWEEGYLLVNNDGDPLTNQEGLPVFDPLDHSLFGLKGDTGDKGEAGERGTSGDQGTKGDPGETGPSLWTIMVKCMRDTTSVYAATGIAFFPIPSAINGCTLTAVQGFCRTNTYVSGGVTVDVKRGSGDTPTFATIFDTLLTIDSAKLSSNTSTTPPVLKTITVATNDQLRIDITGIGSGGGTATGLDVAFTFTSP